MNLTLTKDDITALRTADRIYVKLDASGSTVSCIKKVTAKKGVFSVANGDSDSLEVRRDFNVDAMIGADSSAFFSCWRQGVWQAIVRLVHPGDTLMFQCLDNGNQYLTDADLHHDELWVSIVRNGKTLVHEMYVASTICKDNLARAIKRKSVA